MQNVELDSEARGQGVPRVEAESADFSALAEERRSARLRLVRARKLAAFALLAVPMVAVVAADALRRGDRLMELHGVYRATYAGAMLESLVLWSLLLVAASRRHGWGRWVAAVLFVVAATFTFGGQQYFFQQYNAYLNVDVSLFASNFMDSVVNQLFADIGNYLPTPDAWVDLAQYETRQWLTLDSVSVPSKWAEAQTQAGDELLPGTTAYTIHGTRHRTGIWEGEPVSTEHEVAFTVFIVCGPAYPTCHLLRLSELDNPLD